MSTEEAPSLPPGHSEIRGDYYAVRIHPDGFQVRETAEGAAGQLDVPDADHLIDLGNVLAIAQDMSQHADIGGAVHRVVFTAWVGSARRELFRTWGQPPQIRSRVSLPGCAGWYRVSEVSTTYQPDGRVEHRVDVFDEMALLRSQTRNGPATPKPL
jgi:hypothetical protein